MTQLQTEPTLHVTPLEAELNPSETPLEAELTLNVTPLEAEPTLNVMLLGPVIAGVAVGILLLFMVVISLVLLIR